MRNDKDPLKEAMLKYTPELASDYKDFVQVTFKAMVADLGESLKGVYSSRQWARPFQGIRDSIHQEVVNYRDVTYSLDSKKLEENAKKYGERVALEWYYKMQDKLGAIDDVTVSDPRRGGDVTVTGRHGSNKVRIAQQRIINVSTLGTLFHQFPARIYVNDKFHSESAYKKLTTGWGLPEIVRERKPKREPIDPDSRPKSYKFNYKVDRPAKHPHRPEPIIGEVRRESAKGMTEEEAWNKIYKLDAKMMEQPYNYYSRVYDPEVIAIFAWNDRSIWKKSSGEPKPMPRQPEAVTDSGPEVAEEMTVRRTPSRRKTKRGSNKPSAGASAPTMSFLRRK